VDEVISVPKTVLIRVVGTQQFPDGDEDKLELVTLGSYHCRRAVYYILYKESAISGLEGVTTSLRVDGEHVVLNRMGTAELKQEFQTGILHRSTYVTPFGSLWLSVLTKHISSNLTAQGGELRLEYDLYVDDSLVSHNCLQISVKEDSPGESVRRNQGKNLC